MKITKIILIITVNILITLSMYGCDKIIFEPKKIVHSPIKIKSKQKNLALVLGGGGAKGFAHVGVLEELEKAGIKPDLIIGCSAGAIVGALYAADPNIQHLKSTVLKGQKKDIMAINIRDWPYSLYSTNKLKDYLHYNLKVNKFEDLKIPFIATATDLQYGNLVSFSQGDLIMPIVGSAACPGVFAPVKIEGQYYVDCGVADPVPVSLARNLGFKKVIAINIAEQLPITAPNHVVGVLKRSVEIAYFNQSKKAVQGADLVIDFNFRDIGTFTDRYNNYLYQEGKKAAKKSIPKILKILQSQ